MLMWKTNCNVVTDKQWTYHMGHSTELLLAHLTEAKRKAVGSGLLVVDAFVEGRKAFNCVSHPILQDKLQYKFGIGGPLLTWLINYL